MNTSLNFTFTNFVDEPEVTIDGDPLEQHGVKGQRWYVITKGKKVTNMTDAELNTVVKRMRLEQQYSQLLSEAEPSVLRRGKSIVNHVIDNTLKTSMTSAATKKMTKVFNKAIGN